MEILDDIEIKVPQEKGNLSLSILGIVSMVAFAVCTIYSMDEIRSIVLSGPVLAALSFASFIVAMVKKKKWWLMHSGGLLLFVLGIFGAIFLFEIGPRKADGFVPFFSLVFGLVYIVTGILLVVKEFSARKRQ